MMLELGPGRRRLRGDAPLPRQLADVGPGPCPGGRCVALAGPPVQCVPVPPRRPALRRHLVQLHGKVAHLPAGHARAPRRCRQHLADRLRERRFAADRRDRGNAVRHPDRRRLRVDRGCHRAGSHRRPSSLLGRPFAPGDHGRRRGGPRGPESTLRRRGPARQRRTRAWARSSTPSGSDRSRATTATTRPCSRPLATAGTGAATSATSTTTAGSTSPAARPTGSASTGRTSRRAPIEAVIGRHPDVLLASVYGVPDPDSGDQVMAALVLREGTDFDPASFATWLDSQPDLGPKWRPRFVRLCDVLPTTPTNKILTRVLVHQKFRSDRVDGDPIYVRERGADSFRRFRAIDEAALRAAFESSGRGAAWDL